MKARDVFGIIVRVVGLFLLLNSLWHIVLGIGIIFQLPIYRDYLPFGGPWVDFTLAVPTFVIGVVFLRFASQIVRFSYPKGKDDPDA